MIPLWVKISYTAMAFGVAVIYWRRYGPQNFLWFSDIALFGMVAGLWLESALIASVLTTTVLLPELLWNVSFFGRLLSGRSVSGLADYMFEKERPLWLRGVSLFHIPLLAVLVGAVWRLGYRADALLYAIGTAWLVLPLSYLLTDPERNINWVHGFGPTRQRPWHPLVHLGASMLGFPVLVFLPSHWLLVWVFA